MRVDYEEAAAILDRSPRMSAVLSRRILADVLKNYAKLDHRRIEAQIDAFIADESHPLYIRENLHHFREAANFGAHTQMDENEEIIDIGAEEAEWTLDILDRLFEYFILRPERDKSMREAMEARIKAAGRAALKPLGEGSTEGDD